MSHRPCNSTKSNFSYQKLKDDDDNKTNIPYQRLKEETDNCTNKPSRPKFLDLFNKKSISDKEEKTKFYVEWEKEQKKKKQ